MHQAATVKAKRKRGGAERVALTQCILNLESTPEGCTRNPLRVDQVTAQCNGEYKTLRCPVFGSNMPTEGHSERPYWWGGCNRADCARCNVLGDEDKGKSGYGMMRGGRLWKDAGFGSFLGEGSKSSFFPGEAINLHYFVFTFPEDLRALATSKTLSKLRKILWDRLEAWILDHQGIPHSHDLGAVECLHPAGDKDPETYAPHFNFAVPGVAVWSGDADRRDPRYPTAPTVIRFKRHFWTNVELIQITDLWRGVLEDVLSREIPGDLITDATYRLGRDLRENKKTGEVEDVGPRKQRHCIRYILRAFPGWGKWTRQARKFGFLAPRKIQWAREMVSGVIDALPWRDDGPTCDHRDAEGKLDCKLPLDYPMPRWKLEMLEKKGVKHTHEILGEPSGGGP